MSTVLATTSGVEASWTPHSCTVSMARSKREARLVYQLRYQVYVYEQGRSPDCVDRKRGEMEDALDPYSSLWYALEGDDVVGTITQTIVGPDFHLGMLPSALELDKLPRAAPLFGFTSRFAIAPEHRGTWVLPSLARHSYAHGRTRGGKFDFMVTSPALVALFERVGYVRYTKSIVDANGRDVGPLIPMVLPATDHEHLRRVRSACLPAAAYFTEEPQWGQWLREQYPMIDVYYGSDTSSEEHAAMLAREAQLPIGVAMELSSSSFAHHIPAGSKLRLAGDRVACSFLALAGKLTACVRGGADWSRTPTAPDGVEFSQVEIRCETDALVLCMPDWAIARLQRRHPESESRLKELLQQSATGSILR